MPLEKEVQCYINEGVDVVTYSGDKLLGGAQGGIISGKINLLNKIHSNPMYRTMRCDKYRIALVEKILRTYITTKEITDTTVDVNVKEPDKYKVLLINDAFTPMDFVVYVLKRYIRVCEC